MFCPLSSDCIVFSTINGINFLLKKTVLNNIASIVEFCYSFLYIMRHDLQKFCIMKKVIWLALLQLIITSNLFTCVVKGRFSQTKGDIIESYNFNKGIILCFHQNYWTFFCMFDSTRIPVSTYLLKVQYSGIDKKIINKTDFKKRAK